MHPNLSTEEAKTLLIKYGFNELQTHRGVPLWKKFLAQFQDILIIILVIAGVIAGFHGDMADMIIIIVIVFLNAIIGFAQEFRTEKTLAALKNMISPNIRALRDDKESLIEVKYLVPGDVVILAEGDKIPADGILLESHSLRITEAVLTGESGQVAKNISDKVYMGTAVVKGSGILKVETTGNHTQFGQIAKLTTETETALSPLQKELKHVGIFIAKITGILCVIVMLISLYRDGFGHLGENFLYAVSLAIAAIPEGLPTTITIALAIGAGVLARKKVIVKKLSSVETLGAVTTICSDKTGTLTRNEMTVREIFTSAGVSYSVTGTGYDARSGKIEKIDTSDEELKKIIEISWKCNDAKIQFHEDTALLLGDPTEGSLITLAEKYQANITSQDKNIDQIFPFDSDRKMMSIISEDQALVKGSPDQILEKCTHYLREGKKQLLGEKEKSLIIHEYNTMAERALRVIAYAYKGIDRIPENEEEAESNLVFVGLVGMIDPPRDEVKDAVKKCKQAGIRIIVITGDHGITAEAISKEIGIITDTKDRVIYTGEEIGTFSDEKLKKILQERKSLIFSRSRPQDKIRIVSLLQGLGEVVAMTGDGVNDAPALKKADIGIAMGITGTEVSKEASSLILLDDSFASIVRAIEEGRRIYQNMRKFIWYMFSSNTGEVVVVVVASLSFFIPNVLTAVLILCINLATDVLPALSMAAGTGDAKNMQIPPRDPKQRILTPPFVRSILFNGLAIGIGVLTIFIITLLRDGWEYGNLAHLSIEWKHAVTAAFASLVVIQMMNTFPSISPETSIFKTNYFKNPYHLGAVTSSLLIICFMIYIPFLNTVFGTVPLSLCDWGIIIGISMIPMLILETRKYLFGKIF